MEERKREERGEKFKGGGREIWRKKRGRRGGKIEIRGEEEHVDGETERLGEKKKNERGIERDWGRGRRLRRRRDIRGGEEK